MYGARGTKHSVVAGGDSGSLFILFQGCLLKNPCQKKPKKKKTNPTPSFVDRLSGCISQQLSQLLLVFLLVKKLRTGTSHALNCCKPYVCCLLLLLSRSPRHQWDWTGNTCSLSVELPVVGGCESPSAPPKKSPAAGFARQSTGLTEKWGKNYFPSARVSWTPVTKSWFWK